MRKRNMLPRSLTVMLTTLTLGVTALTSGLAIAAKGTALKAGNEDMVVDNYPNQMHVLDLASDTLYKTCAMHGRFGPCALQGAPDNKTAYILNNGYEDT